MDWSIKCELTVCFLMTKTKVYLVLVEDEFRHFICNSTLTDYKNFLKSVGADVEKEKEGGIFSFM